MKVLSVKTFIILVITVVVISGVINTLEMNSSALSNKKVADVKSVVELTDSLSLANRRKSYKFRQKSFQIKAEKIKKSVNSSPKIKRIEQKKIEQTSYIQEDISLELVEYYNPKKFTTMIKVDEKSNVSGYLEAANGVIETIDVTLPDGDSLVVEYGEMNQNRFTYTIDGEPLRGIIYKIDAVTYMVSLDEGPHAGTRMKFKNTQDIDTTYDEPVDSKIVEASLAAQEKGFTF